MVVVSGNCNHLARCTQADIIAVGWKKIDFAFEVAARQCEFRGIAIAAQVTRDENLEFFVTVPQVVDKFGKGAQASAVMPKQPVEYGEVVEADLQPD